MFGVLGIMMSLFASFDMKIFHASAIFVVLLLPTIFFSNFFFNNSYYSNVFVNSIKNFIYLFQKTKSNMPQFYMCYFVSLFFLIFFLNIFSVGPYTFPLNSQLSFVLSLALLSWLPMIIFFLKSNPKGFLFHLVPESSPIMLVPMLVIIELVSSVIRPLTLTIRLVANIVAGHVLMELYCSMGWSSLILFSLYPLLSLVEMMVASIQAYVFMMMSLLYLAEML